MTTKELAAALNVSRQRVFILAKRRGVKPLTVKPRSPAEWHPDAVDLLRPWKQGRPSKVAGL